MRAREAIVVCKRQVGDMKGRDGGKMMVVSRPEVFLWWGAEQALWLHKTRHVADRDCWEEFRGARAKSAGGTEEAQRVILVRGSLDEKEDTYAQ